jgi:ribonuclease P protein component
MVMIGRIRRSVDFERVLRTPIRSRTLHFALHHLAQAPSKPRPPASERELSTDGVRTGGRSVDEAPPAAVDVSPPDRVWWGAVVPKRHARRSVTRSLLKRQIRACIEAGGSALDAGLWVVRLRAPFDRQAFPSAASDALKAIARSELRALLGACVRP